MHVLLVFDSVTAEPPWRIGGDSRAVGFPPLFSCLGPIRIVGNNLFRGIQS